MFGIAIPSWITENLGYLALAGAVAFGLNMVKNYGYEQRDREYIQQEQVEKKIREEAAKEADERIDKAVEEINTNFDTLKDQLIAELGPNAPQQPDKPKPPTPKPKPAPKPPVTTTVIVDTGAVDIEPQITEEPPAEIMIAWEAYELALAGGIKP